jgi:hypothetical protein
MDVLTALLLALVPYAGPVEDRVDVVEINHFYDDQGRLVFDQAIFWDWCPANERFRVRDWRLLKTPAQIPQRSVTGGYVAVWFDGDAMRRVRCRQVRESWTMFDPELAQREILPKANRRELSRP